MKWVAIFGIIGFAASFVLTMDGPNLPSGDSVNLVQSAKSISASGVHGFPTFGMKEDAELVMIDTKPNTVWPPMMSAATAALTGMGIDLQSAVRWQTVLLSALTLMSCFILSCEITRSIVGGVATTTLLLILFPFRYWLLEGFMAEGIFISTTVLCVVAAHRLLQKATVPSWWQLILLGAFAGTTYYQKSVAPAFIVSVPLMVLLKSGKLADRVRICTSYFMGSFAICLPLFLRNLSLGTVGGSGPGARTHAMAESALSLVRLFVPRHGAFTESTRAIVMGGLLLLLIGLFSLLIIWKLPQRKICLGSLARTLRMGVPARLLSICYVGMYILAVLAALYLVPKASHIETRYWMEMAPFFMPVCWWLMTAVIERIDPLFRKVAIVLVALGLVNVVAASLIEQGRTAGFQRNILQSGSHQLEMRQKICRMLSVAGDVAFISNQGYRLETETGLTSVIEEHAKRLEGVHVAYAAYPEESASSMSLVKNPPQPPNGWKLLGIVGEISIYGP